MPGSSPARATIIATTRPERFRALAAASGIALAAFAPVPAAGPAANQRPAPRLRLVHDADHKAAA